MVIQPLGLHFLFFFFFVLFLVLVPYICLRCHCFRVDAIEQIEDGLTGLKVIAFTENCIRLSLQTYTTELEDLLHQQKIEQIVEPFEVIHELLIEVLEGTMELKSVEVLE